MNLLIKLAPFIVFALASALGYSELGLWLAAGVGFAVVIVAALFGAYRFAMWYGRRSLTPSPSVPR